VVDSGTTARSSIRACLNEGKAIRLRLSPAGEEAMALSSIAAKMRQHGASGLPPCAIATDLKSNASVFLLVAPGPDNPSGFARGSIFDSGREGHLFLDSRHPTRPEYIAIRSPPRLSSVTNEDVMRSYISLVEVLLLSSVVAGNPAPESPHHGDVASLTAKFAK